MAGMGGQYGDVVSTGGDGELGDWAGDGRFQNLSIMLVCQIPSAKLGRIPYPVRSLALRLLGIMRISACVRPPVFLSRISQQA